ncbi:DNA polymerase III subunit delta [Paenibacillus alginolyticus]|uniref:DNA polymerase III subunit delta n=1 Tax=Paenibacillus alginolyticus TaxID=59839 RepID=A0ABT4GI20_9BACL|nr:DNA polymerase III subunit delta [Paenibacillus alginolyticus]MCY9669429.1 DNA polymerase III subunit delta [Paenibacillus alginolyticus]MCY9695842.1 DNA polymerase III subunit delta [Paenibacillus alginolyticus]MEC0148659.1 DNA polymerase III subunit delta [Paenibacillus alginolyticus]
MDAKRALKDIQAGRPAPVYLCYGPEKYKMREFIQVLTDLLIEPEHKEFAVSKFDLSEISLSAVLEDAETLPFMVPKKLVIAKNALFFTGAKESSKIEHHLDRLTDYLKSPADHTVVVFTVDADKLDERKKIVKALKDLEAAVPFLSLSPEELQQWVAKQAQQLGFTFTGEAADQLILYTGGNLQSLSAEIEKISLYVGVGSEASVDVIDQLVARSTEQNVFILIEDIVNVRLERAFVILEELLKQREEPIKIAALIARQFRIMLQVKELSKQGYSQQQMASQIGLHPFAVKVAEGQARKYDIEKLSRIMSQLADLDFQMKTGKIDKVLGLELFLLRLAA